MLHRSGPRAGHNFRAAAPGLAVAVLLVAWLPLRAAEEPPPSDEAPPAAVPETDQENPGVAPEVQSPFQTRTYRARPKKLWKDLLEQLEAAGFPPEEVDDDRFTVRTSFVDFKQDDYSEAVADRPPYLSPRYPILQMVKVREGKVSLEAIIARKGRASELKLRARILVQGVDRRQGIRVLTDRRSSGVIESDFLLKLETALGLERIVDEE